MSGQKDEPFNNLLFSPSNRMFTSGDGTSALLLPVAASISPHPNPINPIAGQLETEYPAVSSHFNEVVSDFLPGDELFDRVAISSTTENDHRNSSSMASQIATLSIQDQSSSENNFVKGINSLTATSASVSSDGTIPDLASCNATEQQKCFNASNQVYSSLQSSVPPPYSVENSETGPLPSTNNSATGLHPSHNLYHPVSCHWCYSEQLCDGSEVWKPFSQYDSSRLELCAVNGTEEVIATEGGRYDVDICNRTRKGVYWEEPISHVRRCTWFSKADSEYKFKPFSERTAAFLEKEYENIVKSNAWHKQIDLGDGETVVIHNPQVIMHLITQTDNLTLDKKIISKIVKRGMFETDYATEIPESEIGVPDHVVFVCHGIGPVFNSRQKTMVDYLNDLRAIHLSLLRSHFKTALESKNVQRIEFLPIHWHHALLGNASGVDECIKRLTLPSIQRLRNFTNESMLDILFYSSPVYCQTIVETVGSEIESLHQLYLARNPTFEGKFSFVGHGLGSSILFDLLCNQKASGEKVAVAQFEENFERSQAEFENDKIISQSFSETSTSTLSPAANRCDMDLDSVLSSLNLSGFKEKFDAEQIELESLMLCSESDLKDIGLPMGPRKKVMGFIKQYKEQGKEEYDQNRMGMPLQDQQNIENDIEAIPPTAQQNAENSDLATSSFNGNHIIDNCDEPMNVHVNFVQCASGTGHPVVNYPNISFKPSHFFALGSPVGMVLSIRGYSDLGKDFFLPTCGNFFNIFHPHDPNAYRIEPLINSEVKIEPVQIPHYKGRKRMHIELRDSLGRVGSELKYGIMNSVKKAMESMQKFASSHWQGYEIEKSADKLANDIVEEQRKLSDAHDGSTVTPESSPASVVTMGKINGGKRVDYVLQERPLESFNDYLFALQTPLCYWSSEDTVLLIMKELYEDKGISPDSM